MTLQKASPDASLMLQVRPRQLLLLVRLDAHRHLGRAAEAMNISQPAATKLLQQQLKTLGYDLGKAGVDGVRGDKTLGALFAYQTTAGLKPDSIDGPKTWAGFANTRPQEVTA